MRLIIFISLILFLHSGLPVSAASPSYGSARLIKKIYIQPQYKKFMTGEKDYRVTKLSDFLEKNNSVLAPYAELIIKKADTEDLPWTLLAAIAGVESSFCRHIPPHSSNCWGWNNGNYYFQDLSSAIETVSQTLNYQYFKRGRNSPELIGPVYAPPSATWAQKVRYFMNIIENQNVPASTSLSISF